MPLDAPVLLIDDDEESLAALSLALQSEGFQVVTATDGQDAIELLESERARPCVILCDVIMPVVDGWEFCRWKAAHPQFQQIPVILTSAHEPPTHLVAGGLANAYLAKPMDIGALVAAVHAYSRRSLT